MAGTLAADANAAASLIALIVARLAPASDSSSDPRQLSNMGIMGGTALLRSAYGAATRLGQ